jgi:hypothetical protein
MKYLTLAALVVLSAVGSQAQTKVVTFVPANPKIYVDAATGFDAYLSEAAARNHVAITLTTQKNDADYEFDAISGGQMVPGSNWPILWSPGNGKAWIRLVNLSDNGLVFACAVDRHSGIGHGPQAAAASCAKRLRAAVKHSAHPSGAGLKAFLLGAPEWNY